MRFLRVLGPVFALMFSSTADPVTSQPISVNEDGIRLLALASIDERNWTQARMLAETLLQSNPADEAALTFLTQSAFQMGDFGAAREAAARLYRSEIPNERRFQAARLAALAAASEDRFTLSELWLRRAMIVAPTAEDLLETTNDARRVRRINPWSTNVQLSFVPSTNINGGASSEFNYIDGVSAVGVLSASAQALSGYVAQADLRTTYRLAETPTYRHRVSGRIYMRAPIPTGDSLEAIRDEGLEIRDFSTARLEFSFNRDQAIEDGIFGISADIGSYWSGAVHDHSYARLGGYRTFSFPEGLSLTGAAYAEQRFTTTDLAPEDLLLGVSGTVTKRLPNRSEISLSLSWLGQEGETINDTYDRYTLQLEHTLAEPIGPVALSGAVGLQHTDYSDYLVGFIPAPGGRQDTRIFGSVTAAFPDYSFAGFSPLMRMNLGNTTSNISRFEISEFGVELGLRSTF